MAQLAECSSSAHELRLQQLRSQVLVKAVLDEQPTLLYVTHDDLLSFARDDSPVPSERVRGSIHRSESGRMRNLATTPP